MISVDPNGRSIQILCESRINNHEGIGQYMRWHEPTSRTRALVLVSPRAATCAQSSRRSGTCHRRDTSALDTTGRLRYELHPTRSKDTLDALVAARFRAICGREPFCFGGCAETLQTQFALHPQGWKAVKASHRLARRCIRGDALRRGRGDSSTEALSR